MVSSTFECFAQEEEARHQRDEEDYAGDEVGEGEGVVFEELDVAEKGWVLLGRLGEETAKGRAEDAADGPDERHQREGLGLKFFLGNHFCYHCTEDTDWMSYVSTHETAHFSGHLGIAYRYRYPPP